MRVQTHFLAHVSLHMLAYTCFVCVLVHRHTAPHILAPQRQRRAARDMAGAASVARKHQDGVHWAAPRVWEVLTLLGASTTWCQHYLVLALLGASTTWCQHNLVSAPLGALHTRRGWAWAMWRVFGRRPRARIRRHFFFKKALNVARSRASEDKEWWDEIVVQEYKSKEVMLIAMCRDMHTHMCTVMYRDMCIAI